MYNISEEQELIRCAQTGNKKACEKLYRTYAGLIKNMSRRYAHTPTGQIIAADALGIMQLAFMDALNDFAPERGIHFAAFLQSRLHSAIYKAFKQACKDRQRTAQLIKPADEDSRDHFDMLESPHASIESEIIARDTLTAMLRQLSKDEQNLFQLLYAQDLSQTRAADILHISPQALYKRKQKLLAKLKKLA